MSLFNSITERVKRFLPSEEASNGEQLASRIDLRGLEGRIGHQIRRTGLFIEALLHRSYLQSQDLKGLKSNERLEFLGDSILNLIVGEYLYAQYPDAEEGDLTKMRSRLVSRKALAAYARELNIEEFMFVSSSAAQSLERGSDSMLADAYEAIIAAIYLDSGYKAAKKFVERQVLGALKSGVVRTADENYKSLLLEHAQAHGLGVPKYFIVKEEGPDHDRIFTVEVIVGDERSGIGVGKTKKEAEQSAAMMALAKMESGDPSASKDSLKA
jgi:ribonuclease-3